MEISHSILIQLFIQEITNLYLFNKVNKINKIKYYIILFYFYFVLENITLINSFKNAYYTWCFNIINISLNSIENPKYYWANSTNKGCLDSIFPFIELPDDIMTSIKD